MTTTIPIASVPRTARTTIVPCATETPRASAIAHGLLLLFLLLLMSSAALLVPGLSAAQPALVAGAAAMAILVVDACVTRRPLRLAWPESHLLLAFAWAAIISCIGALWLSYAIAQAILLLKFLVIYFVMVGTIDSPRRLLQTMLVLGLGGLFPAIGAIWHHQTGHVIEGSRAGWIGIFANPNELAFTLVLLLPVLLGCSGALGRAGRLLVGAAAAVFLFAIGLSYSRGGLLAFGVVATLCALRWGGVKAKAALLVLACLALAAAPAYWSRREGISSLDSDFTTRQRLTTIRVGLAMFADHPLFGVGLGCSVVGFPAYASFGETARGALITHNLFVQSLAETGAVGTSLLLATFAAAIVTMRRHARTWRTLGREDMHRFVSGIEISLWGLLTCGLSGGLLLTWFPYLLLGLASSAALVGRAELRVVNRTSSS